MNTPAYKSPLRPVVAGAVIGSIAFSAGLAEAYVGPGAGLSAIGIVFALVATVALAIVGFVWYPVKRLMRKRSGTDRHRDDRSRPAENRSGESTHSP